MSSNHINVFTFLYCKKNIFQYITLNSMSLMYKILKFKQFSTKFVLLVTAGNT